MDHEDLKQRIAAVYEELGQGQNHINEAFRILQKIEADSLDHALAKARKAKTHR